MARRQQANAAVSVETVLDTLRRTPHRVGRQSRAAVENAVSQLLRSAFTAPASGGDQQSRPTYRIDELARRAGTTTRNVRAYQERGLLPPPRLAGRLGLFDDSHLARLKIIGSMLDRGYTSAHIREMLNAWEQGKDLSDVLGLESALVQSWTDDQPTTMPIAELRKLAGDQHGIERLVSAKLVEVRGTRALVRRPKLLQAFAEMRAHGMSMDAVLDVHKQVEPALDDISAVLVRAGAQHLAKRFSPDTPPSSAQIAELVGMLVRFRTLAMASVTATLATSMERTIETALADYLAHFLDNTVTADAV